MKALKVLKAVATRVRRAWNNMRFVDETAGHPQPENWLGIAEVAAGTKHLQANPPVPCQDAAIAHAGAGVRPCAFVADGAGSAPLSHFGAQAAVLRLSHLAISLEDIHAQMLDTPQVPTSEECRRHAHRFLVHASETIRHLAKEKSRSFREFRCTLLAVIVGAERIFWIKLGDGHIVREKSKRTRETVGPLGKGEYANVTHFIDGDINRNIAAAKCGLFPAGDITGVAVMTDGAAEKLVSADGTKTAGRIKTFFSDLRSELFEQEDLRDFLTDSSVWKPPGYTGDDKGIALLSRRNTNKSKPAA